MKKAYKNIGENIIFFSLLYAFFLCINSCGLDVFYYIDPPHSPSHAPLFTTLSSSDDYAEKYFEFTTNETSSSEINIMKGTNVYYKIYEDYSTMYSHVSVIENLLSSSSTSGTASEMLIESSTYDYQPLVYNGQATSYLIPFTGENQKVYIRLSDYKDIDSFHSRIVINGDKDGLNGKELGQPIRSRTTKYTFNFGRDGDYNKIPTSEDSDTVCSSSTTETLWYIAMFAVAEGRDEYFSKVYSTPVYLGNIVIDSSTEDN